MDGRTDEIEMWCTNYKGPCHSIHIKVTSHKHWKACNIGATVKLPRSVELQWSELKKDVI